MPGRTYSATNQYRYGFNGKENDKDISEGGQDYGMRISDTRLGRFLSVDPISKDYPWYTPYQFAGNNPVSFIDLDGLEPARPKNGAYSDAPDVPENSQVLMRQEEVVGNDPITQFTFATLEAGVKAFGGLTEMAFAAHKGPDYVKKHPKNFPLTGGDLSFKAIMTGIIMTPVMAINNIIKDPTNPRAWGEGFAVFMLYNGGSYLGKFKGKGLGLQVDLMGGAKSRYGNNWINYDLNAKSGIKDGIGNFGNHFGEKTISQMVVDNPQASFLEHVGGAIEEGGVIVIRGGMSNKFFKEVYNGKAKGMEAFDIISKVENVPNPGFMRSDGQTPVGGKINQIILQRK